MTLTVAQCRAGRALVGWSIADLAEAAAVGVMTVNRFESGQPIRPASMTKLLEALTSAGVAFIAAREVSAVGGEGVRLAFRSPADAE